MLNLKHKIMSKKYPFEILVAGEVVLRTKFEDKVQKKVAELQAKNTSKFTVKNNETQILTAYYKEPYEKNYKSRIAQFEKKPDVPKE